LEGNVLPFFLEHNRLFGDIQGYDQKKFIKPKKEGKF